MSDSDGCQCAVTHPPCSFCESGGYDHDDAMAFREERDRARRDLEAISSLATWSKLRTELADALAELTTMRQQFNGLQRRIEEAVAENTRLREENARLRAALPPPAPPLASGHYLEIE